MLDVVLPFRGRADLVIPCLWSLAQCWHGNGKVILVDDATPHHESAHVSAVLPHLGLSAEWVSNAENRGFLASVNEGVRRCSQPYVVLLNSDTILPPDCLRKMSEVLHRFDAVGAVAPVSDNRSDLFQFRSRRVSETGEALKVHANFASSPETSLPASFVLAPYVTAMCLGLRYDLFQRLGFLDPAYRHGYFEDLDLSCRIRAAGYHLAILEDCLVHHEGQGSYRLCPGIFDVIRQNFLTFEARWGHLPEHEDLLQRLRATVQ